MKKYTRKLTKTSSHSYVLNVPKEIVKSLGWKEKQKIDVVRKGKKVVLQDWPSGAKKK